MTMNEQKSKNWSPFNHSLLLLLLLLMLLLMCGNQVVSVFGDTGSVRVTFVPRTFDNLLLYHKIILVKHL